MTKKRGLGRGLDALLAREDEPITKVQVSALEPNPQQPRKSFSTDDLRELAESIQSQGVVQPLVVTPRSGGGYAIVAGERRWRAARLAGLKEVPVVVRHVSDERELLELALVENLQRSDLNPLEESRAYENLQESFGLSQEDIARKVGKSRSTVTNALRLLRLPELVLEFLESGCLTPGQARPLLSLSSPEEQIALAKRIVKLSLPARQVEKIVSQGSKRPGKKGVPEKDVHLHQAQERLTRHLQTKSEIVRKGRGGLIRIHFHSEEELIRIFERLLGSPENKEKDR